MDAWRLYEDREFRKLVESGEVIYVSGRYVINNEKYVVLTWEDVPKATATADRSSGPYKLTDYALAHPQEAFLSFAIDHKHMADGMESGVLWRKSDEQLKLQTDITRKLSPDIAANMKIHEERFNRFYEKENGKHLTFSQFASLLITYRYGRMDDFEAAGTDWYPEEEMPDVYEQYMSLNRWKE